jgi:tetratricopeptide (TPR) repeat protein
MNGLGGLYRTVLSGKGTLILLDNAADREQVEQLAPPSGCAVIITSRNKFALPGLKEKDLYVLPLEDSKKLLLEIARRIGSHAEELARLCGCLPIALRNAAYTLVERKDLRVWEYLNRLKDAKKRLKLVEASFSLSYELLSPELQRLWCMLSVFPADFDRAGAAAVWEIDFDSAAEALSSLFKLSLVEYHEAAGRYHLHDLARDFAASRVEPGAKSEAQQRHAEHYRIVLFASNELYKKGGEGILASLQLFDLEEINIKAGWIWAEMNLEGSSSAADLCRIYPDAGVYVLDLRLHPMEMIRWLETALAAARQLKDRNMEGVHLGNLGRTYALLSETHKAVDYYERALAIAREIGDKKNEGAWLGCLGSAYHALGETRKAIDYYDQAIAIARRIQDKRNEGINLGNLGQAYSDLGEMRKTIDYYERALAIAREIGDKKNEGSWLGSLGVAYFDLGDARKAIEYYEQALAIAREIEDKRGEGTRLGNLGLAYAALGDIRKAIEYYEQALAITREIEDNLNEGVWLGNLGNAYAAMGDARRAVEYYEQSLAIAREIEDKRGEGFVLFDMSLSFDKLNQRSKAKDLAKLALAIFEQIESPYVDRVKEQLERWQK